MQNIPEVFWLVPIASLVALGMALYFYLQMKKADEGTERMREIAMHVRKGAMAYLKQQYSSCRIPGCRLPSLPAACSPAWQASLA